MSGRPPSLGSTEFFVTHWEIFQNNTTVKGLTIIKAKCVRTRGWGGVWEQWIKES